jgi:hypothetical protein
MKICSKHRVESEWKEGTSKAGKHYAFWACPEKPNGEFCRADQIDSENDPQADNEPWMNQQDSPTQRKAEEEVDGKIRHGISIAMIEKGAALDKATAEEIERWVIFIKTGKFVN